MIFFGGWYILFFSSSLSFYDLSILYIDSSTRYMFDGPLSISGGWPLLYGDYKVMMDTSL